MHLSLTLIYTNTYFVCPNCVQPSSIKQCQNCFTIVPGKWQLPYLMFFLLYRTVENVYQHHLWKYHWPVLHSLFHQMLGFALWLSIIVEDYQVKFPYSEDNQLKFLKIPLPTIFCTHRTYCRSYLKESKLISPFFKKGK